MESTGGGGPRPRGDGPAVSGEKLRRVMRAVYLVLVKKHQPKLAALGVHLHRLVTHKRQCPAALALSCRSMDPAAAVVHPLPRDRRRQSSSEPARAGSTTLSSLSCRSMDPAAVLHQHQYRPREVQFSCKSTPPHKRRRAIHHQRSDHHRQPLELEYDGSAAAVTRLFELMDGEEEAANKATADVVDFEFDDGDLVDLETAAAWPALSVGPAPRQVRITDSPFPMREEDDEGKGMVDRRADEFITWFHEQLRTQQQQQRAAVRTERAASYYWIR